MGVDVLDVTVEVVVGGAIGGVVWGAIGGAVDVVNVVLEEDGVSFFSISSFLGIREVGLGEAISPNCDLGKAMSYFGDIGRVEPLPTGANV